MTAIELLASPRRFDLVAFVLATASGAAMGAWLAALLVLVAVLARRRGWQWPERLRPSTARYATLGAAALLAALALPLAWWVVGEVHGVVEERPIDYPETSRQLWRGVALVAGPAAVVGFVIVAAPLARWLEARARGALALRLGATLALTVVVAHLGSGAFTVYFGSELVMALVIAVGIAAASWLPSTQRGTIGALACLALPLVVGLGIVGLHHAAARALLLHRTQLATTIAAVGIGWLDGDGDGDLPPWLGGGDCDDDDSAIATSMPELPGNGVDDNCWAGDRAAVEPVRTRVVDGPRPPIVLVTIDTVRADRLELLGSARPTMPLLNAYAQRGLVFERAYSPANHTFYSMTALLAGQATERMVVPGSGAVPKIRFVHWLPQRLHELGYYTVAINPPLVVDGKLAPEELRVDEVDLGPFDGGGKNRSTTSKQIADDAVRRIEGWKDERPLALWIHFMDPHAFHEAPLHVALDDGRDAYDDELSWVDLNLGRVLAAVERRFHGEAIVAITSDHGESLGEDGDWGHGFGLAEREIHVPLVLVAKGVAAGRRSDPVSTLSLVPTLLELLGQPRDPALVDAPTLRESPGFAIAENPALLWNELRMEAALVEPTLKLVWARTSNTLELFDLAADPHERVNLASTRPDELARMLERLRNELEAGH
ncbi:MAG TPA: sulfatase-like hydrolase/transferase [Nannocystaceae bacterium]|nr:sulfatase-like hydrolase/transferase [Nannocystaceae bacterium]